MPLQEMNITEYDRALLIRSNNLGRRISYVNIPDEDARKAMKGAGM
jgi:hypothetical protein